MAITATLKTSGEFGLSTSAATKSTALGAITFAAGSLVVVVLGEVKSSATATQLACTEAGLTFTNRASASQLVANKADAAILTAPDAAGGSRTITITSGTRTCFGLFYAVYEITGQHASPIGGNATQADNLTDGAKTMTLSVAPATDSLVMAGVCADTSAGLNTVDPGATFTESVEVDSAGATNFGVMEVETRTGSTSTTADWTDVRAGASVAVASTAGVALEIIAAAVAYPFELLTPTPRYY